MAVLYACVYKCSIKMCDFSYYDEGKEKETNFYIFIGGDGKFILIFSPFLIRRTDCLTCKIADMHDSFDNGVIHCTFKRSNNNLQKVITLLVKLHL